MDSRGLKYSGKAFLAMLEVLIGMGLVFSAGQLLEHGWRIAQSHWEVYAALVSIPLLVSLIMVYIIRSKKRPGIVILILSIISVGLMLGWLYLGFPMVDEIGEILLWVAGAVACGLGATLFFNLALGRKGEWLRNLVPG